MVQAQDEPPVSWRELLAVILLVVLADVTVYRGQGYAGYAALFAGAPASCCWGCHRWRTLSSGRRWGSAGIVGIMLVILAARMLWCGWALHNVAGLVLLIAFALALSGLVPYVLEILVFPAHAVLGGLLGLAQYTRLLRRPGGRWNGVAGLSVILPLVVFVAFSVLFILANPDLLTAFGDRISRGTPGVSRVVDRVFAGAGRGCVLGRDRVARDRHVATAAEPAVAGGIGTLGRESQTRQERRPPSPLYAACRNTLVTVIVLFAIYLVFEFKTLWWRVFPPGFHYSGYAHPGSCLADRRPRPGDADSLAGVSRLDLVDPRLRGLGAGPGSGRWRTCCWRSRSTIACTSTSASTA